MNILAIYTYEYLYPKALLKKPLLDFRYIQIGFTGVLTNIIKRGHNVNLEVYTQYTDIEKFTAEILRKKYDLVCLTSVTAHIEIVKAIVKQIKKIRPCVKVLIGGHHATLFPDDLGKNKNFDAVCIGEGFKTTNLYLDYLEGKRKADEVPGFWIREKGLLIKNKPAEFCDFREFPQIYGYLWEKWVDNTDIQSVLVSRGCPNNCSFCSNHVLREKNSGTYVQFRNIEDIIKEIRSIRKKYPKVHTILLETETFSMNLNYTYQLLDKLKQYNERLKNKLKFCTNLLFNNNIKKDMKKFVKKLKDANFSQVYIGLESGSQRIRKEILHRPHYTNEDLMVFCRYMQKKGILIALNVMVGLPTETVREIDQTIAVLNKINPHNVRPSIFCPYPSTDIYNFMLKNKMIKKGVFITGWEERRNVRLGYDILSKDIIQKKFNDIINNHSISKKSKCINTLRLMMKYEK